jgi:hypothetical protein
VKVAQVKKKTAIFCAKLTKNSTTFLHLQIVNIFEIITIIVTAIHKTQQSNYI